MAFGEILFDEHAVSPKQPYLFNGKELDMETGLYYYGARYYDSKVSLWLNVDPLAEEYPNISPYTYVANNPINAIDPDGRWIIFLSKTGQQFVYSKGSFYYANITKDKKGNYSVVNTGKKYEGKRDYTLYSLEKVYRKIEKSDIKELKGQLHRLEKSKKLHFIRETMKGEQHENAVSTKINIIGMENINAGSSSSESKHTMTNLKLEHNRDLGNGEKSTFETTVIHEMRHQYDYEIGNMGDDTEMHNSKNPVEIRAVYNENLWRKKEGLPQRKHYGNKINPQLLNNPPNNKNE